MLREDLAARWNEIIVNPLLQDLPFKIELNGWGRIEMSPASNLHGKLQIQIAQELSRKRGGVVLSECSIQTKDGVRVANVAWLSKQRDTEMGDVTPYPRAPEICVEIMSPSNSWPEMHMKAALYLEAGAREVWIQPIEGKRVVICPE